MKSLLLCLPLVIALGCSTSDNTALESRIDALEQQLKTLESKSSDNTAELIRLRAAASTDRVDDLQVISEQQEIERDQYDKLTEAANAIVATNSRCDDLTKLVDLLHHPGNR